MDSGSDGRSDDSLYADTAWEDSDQITRNPKPSTNCNKHQRLKAKNHSNSKTLGQERQLVAEDGAKEKSHEVEETSYTQNQESNS